MLVSITVRGPQPTWERNIWKFRITEEGCSKCFPYFCHGYWRPALSVDKRQILQICFAFLLQHISTAYFSQNLPSCNFLSTILVICILFHDRVLLHLFHLFDWLWTSHGYVGTCLQSRNRTKACQHACFGLPLLLRAMFHRNKTSNWCCPQRFNNW